MLVRRMATVTICAPEASMAARVWEKSWYLPVPTRSREWNVRSPMASGSWSVSGAFMATFYAHCPVALKGDLQEAMHHIHIDQPVRGMAKSLRHGAHHSE